MDLQKEELETLLDLGLRITEAKVYLKLIEQGTIKVSVISKVSKVARPEVYRALSSLQEGGLVEKIVANPLLFRARPVEQGISILLEQKANKYAELESQSVALIRKLKNKSNHNHVDEHSQFVLVPSKQAIIKALRQSIANSTKCIDLFTSFKRLKFTCNCLFDELENAWQKGVKARVIIEENGEQVFDFQKTCWRKPHAKIKYIQSFPKAIMGIYDSKEVFIFVENEADFTDSSALWSNNSSLVSLAQYGFNSCWRKAKERPK